MGAASLPPLVKLLALGLTLAAGHGTPALCECPPVSATVLVLVESNVGSTWLGQMLHKHHCSRGFIPNHTRDDGRFRPHTVNEVLRELSESRPKPTNPHHLGPHGVMLWWHNAKLLMIQPENKFSTPVKVAPDSANDDNWRSLVHPWPVQRPLVVLALTRDPFFMAISQIKKQKLNKARKKHMITCNNVNQRGTDKCQAANSFTFEVKPTDLQGMYEHQATSMRELVAVAQELALANNGSYYEVSYASLVCQSEIKRNTLPHEVMRAVGLPTNCDEKEDVHTVKSSPKNSARELTNMDEVMAWAKQHNVLWQSRFALPKENDELCPANGTAPPPAVIAPLPGELTDDVITAVAAAEGSSGKRRKSRGTKRSTNRSPSFPSA